jgi:NADH:ubiquinone oxidoreductase subunit F (NADH-binding)
MGILLDGPPVATLDDYRRLGGGRAAATADRLGPAQLRKEVLLSGLRGRGGGGFRTGRKWAGVVDSAPGPRFAVANGAEGEPGTFKDRAILRHNPFAVLEGLCVAALAVEADVAFFATKAGFVEELARVRAAWRELETAGLTGGIEVRIVEGPDEYLFGEEKALLEVIEGREPLPRLLPPFEHGLFAQSIVTGWAGGGAPPVDPVVEHPNPTAVNNVETLANVPFILERGADWYRSIGTPESPGTLVCTIVGDVRTPQVIEVDMGTPLQVVIDAAGGVSDGRRPLAALSGVANPVIGPEHFATPLDHESYRRAGLGLGSAGFIVYDDTACPVAIAAELSRFLYVESCGQCRSCKFGCGEITRHLDLVAAGAASENDIEVIGARLRSVNEAVRCYLATEEQVLVASMLSRFPEEFALHLEGRCSLPEPRSIFVPKIVDLRDGQVTYDERHRRKQPDWTYAEPG